MGILQELQTARQAMGDVLHNFNTALTEAYGVEQAGTLSDITDRLAAVHAHGYTAGHEAGQSLDYADGKQAQYDAFWDAYQQNGTKTNYSSAFYYTQWTDAIFAPKYDMYPTSAQDMFAYSCITDLPALLGDVTLDFSRCTSLLRAFNYATALTQVGTVDASSATDVRNLFANCTALKRIAKLICSETTGTQYSNTLMFQNCAALMGLDVEGTVCFSLDLHWSPLLSWQSIESIVAALSDTVTGQTLTLSAEAVANGETADGDWETLIASKPNWTFTTL